MDVPRTSNSTRRQKWLTPYMPELPEVETIKCDLSQSCIIGQTIKQVEVYLPKIISGDSAWFKNELIGEKILSVSRRGKYLLVTLASNKIISIHLRMSGHLELFDKKKAPTKHEHVRFIFKNELILSYFDVRKFGKIALNNLSALKKLGPEPLECDEKLLSEILATSKKAIKALLLDQTKIAGIGNIYADEILWKAKLHPKTKAHLISKKKTGHLLKAMQETLLTAIEHRGTSLGNSRSNFHSLADRFGENQNYLNAYGRKGMPCKRCATPIKREKTSQRSTYFCPNCQI